MSDNEFSSAELLVLSEESSVEDDYEEESYADSLYDTEFGDPTPHSPSIAGIQDVDVVLNYWLKNYSNQYDLDKCFEFPKDILLLIDEYISRFSWSFTYTNPQFALYKNATVAKHQSRCSSWGTPSLEYPGSVRTAQPLRNKAITTIKFIYKNYFNTYGFFFGCISNGVKIEAFSGVPFEDGSYLGSYCWGIDIDNSYIYDGNAAEIMSYKKEKIPFTAPLNTPNGEITIEFNFLDVKNKYLVFIIEGRRYTVKNKPYSLKLPNERKGFFGPENDYRESADEIIYKHWYPCVSMQESINCACTEIVQI